MSCCGKCSGRSDESLSIEAMRSRKLGHQGEVFKTREVPASFEFQSDSKVVYTLRDSVVESFAQSVQIVMVLRCG